MLERDRGLRGGRTSRMGTSVTSSGLFPVTVEEIGGHASRGESRDTTLLPPMTCPSIELSLEELEGWLAPPSRECSRERNQQDREVTVTVLPPPWTTEVTELETKGSGL